MVEEKERKERQRKREDKRGLGITLPRAAGSTTDKERPRDVCRFYSHSNPVLFAPYEDRRHTLISCLRKTNESSVTEDSL